MRARARSSVLIIALAFAALCLPGPLGAATAPVKCGGPRIVKAGGGYWTCTFDDEFSSYRIDASKWTVVTTAASGITGGGACFVNSSQNIHQFAGHLYLTVRKVTAPIRCIKPHGSVAASYTAATVATAGSFAQAYGRFSIRAKFPAATVAGLHSALWLWPKDATKFGAWPRSGEIDIGEEYSLHADRVVPYVHYVYDPRTVNLGTNTNVPTNNYCLVKQVNQWHVYTVEWTPRTITIFYDNQICLIDNYVAAAPLRNGAPFNQPFFVALTQSLGIAANSYVPGSTPLPATTQVDWVRVWK
jgi:beta-glucanase (GH16 family)